MYEQTLNVVVARPVTTVQTLAQSDITDARRQRSYPGYLVHFCATGVGGGASLIFISVNGVNSSLTRDSRYFLPVSSFFLSLCSVWSQTKRHFPSSQQ